MKFDKLLKSNLNTNITGTACEQTALFLPMELLMLRSWYLKFGISLYNMLIITQQNIMLVIFIVFIYNTSISAAILVQFGV